MDLVGPRVRARFVHKEAVGAGAALVFVDYRRSPEARYPSAIEDAFAALEWIAAGGAARGLSRARVAVACQVLFHRVTDAAFDTASLRSRLGVGA